MAPLASGSCDPSDDRASGPEGARTTRDRRRSGRGGRAADQPSVLRDHKVLKAGHVTGCAIARDSTWVVTTARSGRVQIWDPTGGPPQAVLVGHRGPVLGCAIAEDSTWLATVGADSTARVWKRDPEGAHAEVVLGGHSGAVTACATTRDGRVVTTGSDATVRVWDPGGGPNLATLAGHSAAVLDCAVAPDANLLVTVSVDGTAESGTSTAEHA